jgi:protein-L-isoaspartate(D-aspartate) O-methyltransferase
MTEALLNGGRPRKVLQVGTGCGYQSAVLAALAEEVFSVERIGDLVRRTRERLQRLQVRNVRIRHGDGYAGWAEYGPFDGILVAAAPTQVPAALLEQLAEGGRLVVPVGTRGSQQLLLVTRSGGELKQDFLEMVSFVPMLHGTGQ